MHKNAGGLSLYERLQRDEELREELMDLLRDFGVTARECPPLVPKGVRGAAKPSASRDAEMVDVPVRHNLKYLAKYTEQELDAFSKYYGAPPQLLDGFTYIKNQEGSDFLQGVTESSHDLTVH